MESLVPNAVLFAAQFLLVFVLVMNSKLLRDDRWILAMLNSLLITGAQYIQISAVSNSIDPTATFLCGAVGGSLGVGASHLLYTRFIFKRKET